MLQKIPKLTPMVRVSNRTGFERKSEKPHNFLKLNHPGRNPRVI